jgi:hypothetical protein
MASLLAAGMQTATWLSAGVVKGVFFSRLARTRATKQHEAAHAKTEAVAEDGRCCMRARCVITEHLGDRRKSPVWSTEATYLLGSAAVVPEERSTALADVRALERQSESAQDPPGKVA